MTSTNNNTKWIVLAIAILAVALTAFFVLQKRQAEVEAKARAEEAAHDAGRAERLYEKKAYSEKALEFDQLNRKTAEAQLTSVREQLAALQSAPPAPTTYEVRAPIAGTVVGVNKSAGEQVAQGEAILEVIALDTVWVEA